MVKGGVEGVRKLKERKIERRTKEKRTKGRGFQGV
ncbi:hypothetical protein T4D_5055 [Trichinella pseudospiralis]|uniref:Uncharacterized protein n=1 Tax=Trichinella pseudospiralis TaxID=6337 RepID=A0A0V1DL95_TRIPS|nr:hypothetical protein T4D_5055 [Trichinella pseudospiralis]